MCRDKLNENFSVGNIQIRQYVRKKKYYRQFDKLFGTVQFLIHLC